MIGASAWDEDGDVGCDEEAEVVEFEDEKDWWDVERWRRIPKEGNPWF